MTGPATAVLTALAVLLLAGCGGGVDVTDPRAVADAWRATRYSCGEQGAGRAWDLQLHKPGDPGREQYLKLERRMGCKPRRVPERRVVLVGERGDQAVVRISLSDDPQSYTEPETVLLVRRDDGWRVDADRSRL